MGCGKSKHDVATGNTITRKKSKASRSNNVNNNNVILGECKNDNVREDVKDITETTVVNDMLGDERKRPDEDNEGGGANVEDGRSISRTSSNHLTSSRKDDDDDDKASENFDDDEERSEYDSPLHETGGDGMLMSESLEADDQATMETGEATRMKEILDNEKDMVTMVGDKEATPLN